MRIVKEVNKGRMKLSVFHYNDQYSIKSEMDQSEIYFKFNEAAVSEAEVDKYYLNEESLLKYESLLKEIIALKINGLIAIQSDKGISFPEII
jgi:L-fucose isomerase-like protein